MYRMGDPCRFAAAGQSGGWGDLWEYAAWLASEKTSAIR